MTTGKQWKRVNIYHKYWLDGFAALVDLFICLTSVILAQVIDATDDEPWGPHGTALAEIAQATKNCKYTLHS
ncbi:clathrin interactor EPSIN 1 [Artemisia annua]|uniref:Clathrin interactor EPSIN 1 n=1 Tax=Artemisia annua TaxID=35608 RepID=A0A2U1KFV4_ARTAN|nr:clathrin interactor EPSIN 1 [Artemisia annua]